MLRKTISLVLAFSGIFVLLTSVILYIEPEGRVAYWADWRFLGLDKHQWGDLHVTTGFLFLIALILHAWLNWKPLISYLKNKARKVTGLNTANLTASIITLYFVVGTLLGLPPMQQIVELGDSIKEGHVQTYGNPPYGHAELSSLESFAAFMRMDPQKALTALTAKGLKVESAQQSLRDMADANNMTPKELFDIMKAANPPMLPDTAPEGTGKMRLSEICEAYGIDPRQAVVGLAGKNITAQEESTMRDIAGKNGITPPELYRALREWSLGK